MPKEWKQLTLGNYFHYYFVVLVGFVETYPLSLDFVLKNYCLLSYFSFIFIIGRKGPHLNASFEIIIICVSVYFKLLRFDFLFSFLITVFSPVLLYFKVVKIQIVFR